MGEKSMGEDDGKRWIFGLSVDDELVWGIAQVNINADVNGKDAYPPGTITAQKICDLPHGDTTAIDLKATIIKALAPTALDSDLLTAFTHVKAVGVSTIGIADHFRKRLLDLRRKALIWERDEDYIIDFLGLFSGRFENIDPSNIAIHNDATAKCLAYHSFCSDVSPENVFCLVNLAEGVNVGIANGFGPLSVSNLHPEVGHAYPPLHPLDKKHSEKETGCPSHITCFEGLLSSHRIKSQWGSLLGQRGLRNLENFPVLDVVSYYLAHLCWTVTTTIVPERILLCGPTASEALAEEARRQFRILNRGPVLHTTPYLRYAAMADMNQYLRVANPLFPPEEDFGSIKDISGLMGAFELARLQLRKAS